MNYAVLISGLLSALIAVAFFDSEYFHRKRFALHAHEETQHEHFLHTLQSFIAAGAIGTLLTANCSGIRLWVGMVLFAASVIVTFIDSAEEIDSRKKFGGLTKLEYCCHLAAEFIKGLLGMALILSKPAEAWGLRSVALEAYPAYLSVTAWILFGLGVYSSVEHIVLGRKHHHAKLAKLT